MPLTARLKSCGWPAAALFCLIPAGFTGAAAPAESLPQGTFATNDGCAALEKSLPEDMEFMDFLFLTNTELMGQEFGCSFVESEESAAAQTGKVWSVRAKCGSGGPDDDTAITIREVGEGQLEVTMTILGGEPDVLGTFIYCPKVLAD
ncbi:MAG: hypothetical protein ACOYB4_08735 [Methyloceanibacter sp.]